MNAPCNPEEKVTYAMYRILTFLFIRAQGKFAVFADPENVVQLRNEKTSSYAWIVEDKADLLIGIYSRTTQAQHILDDLQAYFGASA